MKAPFPPSQDPPCSPSLSSASSRTDPEAPSPDAQPSSRICKARTRNGKVARLPKPLRDRINLLIRDGLSYRAILKKLGDDAQDLTLNNLSEWKRGGYVDWLEELHWAEELRAWQETTLPIKWIAARLKMGTSKSVKSIPHAWMPLATLQTTVPYASNPCCFNLNLRFDPNGT